MISNRIEERRKELGFSKRTIYEKVGICRKSYYLYTKVGLPIPSDKLIRFSKALDCSIDYLLNQKNYTQITIVDNQGVVIADISQDKIIEHSDYKVILT